uniref:Ubiquinone biosynthesis O-methyltransferase, mitochondrial n=1 Tax=Ascaris lumbricoides TaxID=6252 RepID=A0A0M3HQ25_ASCLU
MSPALSGHGYRMRLGLLRRARSGHATLCERLASSSSASTAFGARLFTNSSFDSVDAEEIRRFGRLSSQWANEEDSFKALHSFNQIRVPWIVDSITKADPDQQEQLAGIRLVDVGCGGGLLSIPLARLGASLCGIDASEEAVRAACIAVSSAFHASPPKCGEIHLECSTVEKFAETNASGFDAVVASEIVEHVANVDTFIKACVRLARGGAPLFFTTINKTLASRIFAVWMAEVLVPFLYRPEVFGAVPSGVHDWSKFIEPEVLRHKLESNGCDVRLVHGIAYNPFANKWSWTDCTAINYALMAVKR